MSVAGVTGMLLIADCNDATVHCNAVKPEDKEENPSIWDFKVLICVLRSSNWSS